jgi:hypothetical protein
LATLVRCLAFPLGDAPAWAIVAQLPLLTLIAVLMARREARDPAWTVVGLGLWSLVITAAIAVARGGADSPTEQQRELLALPLVWNYLAITRLRRHAAPGSRAARVLAWASPTWLALALGLLGAHILTVSWPVLHTAHETRASAAEGFRAVLERGMGAAPEGDEPLPLAGHPSLDPLPFAHDPDLASLLPPELTAPDPLPPPAHLTALVGRAWPVMLAVGGLLLVSALCGGLRTKG